MESKALGVEVLIDLQACSVTYMIQLIAEDELNGCLP